MVKDLKKAAVDEERNVYDIVEEAVSGWMTKNRGKTVG